MRKILLISILYLSGSRGMAISSSSLPGQFLVKLKPSVKISAKTVEAFGLQTGSYVRSQIPEQGILVVQRASFETLGSAERALSAHPWVEKVEANAVFKATEIPDDADYPGLWQLNNIHRQNPIDINAEKAWDITTGSDRVVVAVIDTGIDYEHPDLKDNIWTNQAELNGKTGVDDDQNGYVDDIHGYNFVDDTGDPMDDGGHGTHCAGSIGAVGGNGIGVVGVNWNVKMMAVKFMDGTGNGSTENAIRAIDYAVKMGARVLSNSWGNTPSENTLLTQAIERAQRAGVLFVVAAGNSHNNNDVTPSFPANTALPNVISVASVQNDGEIAETSNYGLNSVDLAAPGVDIYSTAMNGRYESRSGTSMAAPFVAGVAALVLSVKPRIKAVTLKKCIVNSVTPLQSLKNVTRTGGLLNAYGAVTNSCKD